MPQKSQTCDAKETGVDADHIGYYIHVHPWIFYRAPPKLKWGPLGMTHMELNPASASSSHGTNTSGTEAGHGVCHHAAGGGRMHSGATADLESVQLLVLSMPFFSPEAGRCCVALSC